MRSAPESNVRYTPVTDADLDSVLSLSEDCRTPAANITAEHVKHFLGARDGEVLVGVIGLEPLVEIVLLRSLAEAYRGQGIAGRLLEEAVFHARNPGTSTPFGLTEILVVVLVMKRRNGPRRRQITPCISADGTLCVE